MLVSSCYSATLAGKATGPGTPPCAGAGARVPIVGRVWVAVLCLMATSAVSAQTTPPAAADSDDQPANVAEVVVTGSRIASRSATSDSPLASVDCRPDRRHRPGLP